MTRFLVVGLLLALLAAVLVSPAHAQAPVSPKRVVESVLTINEMITQSAIKYGVSRQILASVIKCESKFNPLAVSKTADYGVAQIHLSAHPTITKSQAFNPKWSIDWMAHEFSLGHQSAWTCWRNLYS